MLSYQFHGFFSRIVYYTILKGFFQYIPPHPHHIVVSLNPRHHDMKKNNESTLPEKAFTQVTDFLAEWFLR